VTQRDRIVVIVIAAVVGLAAYWMLALKPKRDEAAKLGKQVDEVHQRMDTARDDLSAGQAARSRYAANYATVARLGKAVPTDDDVPSLVYQLDSTAQDTGVDFRSVKIASGAGTGAPSPQTAAPATSSKQGDAQQKAGSEDASSKSSSGDNAAQQSGAEVGPAAPTQAATAALPPGAVVGPAGLSTMPFSFSFEGSFFRLADFFTRIDRYIKPRRSSVDVRGRLLLINGISLNAAGSGFPKMKASISAQAYLLPADQGLFDGATAQSPTHGGTQPVNSNGSASPAPPATVTP
jgi:hypothetical protein